MSVDSTIRKAQKLAKAGDREGAAALLRQVLTKSPGNRVAARGLAALTGAGTGAAARRAARTAGGPAAGQAPAPGQLRAVETLMKRGDPARAVAEARRLSLLFPASAAVFNLLGIALTRAGRRDDAVTAFSRLAELTPKSAAAQFNKANALAAAGRFDDAATIAREALRLDPKMFPAVRLLGFAQAQARRYPEAEASFRKAIRMAPANPQGQLGLGNVLATTHRTEEALAAYEAARDLDPDNADVANNIGATLVGLDRLEEAVETLARAVEAHPKNRMLHTNMAKALRDLGQPEQALEHVAVALDLGPETGELLGLKASALREMGETDAVQTTLARAVELDPDNSELLAIRWRVDPMPLDHPDHARMVAAARSPDIPPRERAKIAFALYTAHDAAGEIDAAAGWLAEGNALHRQANPYDIEAEARRLDALGGMYAAEAPLLSEADTADIPARQRIVFIVGMPRSGTSLVEQILASHSQVHGAGELPLLNAAMQEIGWGHGDIGPAPTRDNLRTLRRSYLDGIDRLGTDAPVVTDKMPLNFRYVGHALAALPEARVLVLDRDARAVCWSNWSHGFRGRANGFGNDLADLARMYRLHEELVEVYRAAYPDRIATVPYERLTEHQEEESRRLVAAAGLDWEPACLDFHKTRRAVRTASAAQVREKMYTGSSEAWRRYEAHLKPLIEALDRPG